MLEGDAVDSTVSSGINKYIAKNYVLDESATSTIGLTFLPFVELQASWEGAGIDQ